MNAHGILFQHRRPDHTEWVARDFAQFSTFAALCAQFKVAEHVKRVRYDTNSQMFHVEVLPDLEHTIVHEVIGHCGEAALSQFQLFGCIHHKREEVL